MSIKGIQKNDDDKLFNKKLKEFEDVLIDFIMDIAKQKKVNEKFSAISAYLLIHRSLTQKELKDLTGFSMGSISTYLSVMMGIGVLEKSRIPNTHTYRYSYQENIENLPGKGVEIALQSFVDADDYLKGIKHKLKKLELKSKRGAKDLSNRIDEALDAIQIFKRIIPLMGDEAILSEKEGS